MSQDTAVSRCRNVRSLLFVPASRPPMIEKAAASAADAVCLDLEDSVVPAEKAAARSHVVQALRTLEFGGRARIVRINGLDSPFAYRDLVDVVEAAGDRIDLIMIPKVGAPREIVFVDMLLTQIEASRGLRTPIRLEAQIETAQGCVYAREIASASQRLDALILGAGDYAASMRMPSRRSAARHGRMSATQTSSTTLSSAWSGSPSASWRPADGRDGRRSCSRSSGPGSCAGARPARRPTTPPWSRRRAA